MFERSDCVGIPANHHQDVHGTILHVEKNGDCIVECSGHISTYKATEMARARLLGRDKNARHRAAKNARTRAGAPAKVQSLGVGVGAGRQARSARGRPARHAGRAFIYMAQVGEGHVKIGRTRNVAKRMKSLQTVVPSAVSVLKTWVVDADEASRLETAVKHTFHKQFAHAGGGTEVFQMSAIDHRRAMDMISRRARCTAAGAARAEAAA
jgi:hypothetical protein